MTCYHGDTVITCYHGEKTQILQSTFNRTRITRIANLSIK